MARIPLMTRTSEELGPSLANLVRIPAGEFLMGCEVGQNISKPDNLSQDIRIQYMHFQDNEKPVHRVWIDEFLLAACQVTNAEYAVFARATGSAASRFSNDPALNQAAQPVVGISWHEAVRYCQWLSAATGKQFRLPTEAEWERASRGGREGALFPWGDTAPQSLPRYAERCAGYWKTGPEPVGGGDANGYGLFNMCDNVHEWCNDWYAPDYYEASPARNPRGPATGTRRASRGGSWRHHVKMSRCAARSSLPPEFQYADYGFRVACGAARV